MQLKIRWQCTLPQPNLLSQQVYNPIWNITYKIKIPLFSSSRTDFFMSELKAYLSINTHTIMLLLTYRRICWISATSMYYPSVHRWQLALNGIQSQMKSMEYEFTLDYWVHPTAPMVMDVLSDQDFILASYTPPQYVVLFTWRWSCTKYSFNSEDCFVLESFIPQNIGNINRC